MPPKKANKTQLAASVASIASNTTIPLSSSSSSQLPFKRPEHALKAARKRWRNLKQLIASERLQTVPVDMPTCNMILQLFHILDTSLDAPPSLLPRRKYCDITGLPAPFTDPKTQLRYHNAEIYQTIQTLAPHMIQQYLSLRNAAVLLK